MIFDPSTMPWRDAYHIMTSSVLPRPIAFVSTVNPDGVYNLAPFSFFNVVAGNPMTLCFSVLRRGSDGAKKDTLINVEATGEFVVNIVSEQIMQQMNMASADVAPDVDEFDLSGLTPAPSTSVRPPRVSESLVSYECKLLQIVPIGQGDPGSSSLIIGTIQRFHVADEALNGNRVRLEVLKPIGRLGGENYVRCTDVFTLPRPGSK